MVLSCISRVERSGLPGAGERRGREVRWSLPANLRDCRVCNSRRLFLRCRIQRALCAVPKAGFATKKLSRAFFGASTSTRSRPCRENCAFGSKTYDELKELTAMHENPDESPLSKPSFLILTSLSRVRLNEQRSNKGQGRPCERIWGPHHESVFLGSHWSIKFSPKDILGWSLGAQ